MEKCFDEKKIAKLTGTAVQDDETFKAEGGFWRNNKVRPKPQLNTC